jgi:ribosomal protein S18 acetylase RimI-like enzyme
MNIREATLADIPEIQIVRNSVTENTLSDPGLVTDEDCAIYLTMRGKGWVCVQDGAIVGFAIADLLEYNIWALFVHPAFEQQGIGKQLHNIMLAWYFSQTQHPVWLSTTPHTRAALFSKKWVGPKQGFMGKMNSNSK